jgi:hypothetical protein
MERPVWMEVDVHCSVFPGRVIFILAFLIPESPRWLIKAGKENKAVNVLRKLGDEN